MDTSKIRTVLFLSAFFVSVTCVEPAKAAAPNVYKPRSPARLITVVDQNVTCEEDGSVQITFEAQGPNGITLSYGIGTKPPYGTLTKIDGNVPTYVYTPTPDFFGQDHFRFSAYSKEAHIGDTYGTISITVTPVPDKPIAINIEVTTAENSPVEIDLAAYDPDGGKLQYTIKNQPKHGELKLIDEASNTYLYTPKTGYKGTDKFYFYVNNGSYDSNLATVNINITQESENLLSNPAKQINVTRLLEPLKVEKPVDLALERKGNLYILSAPENGQSKVLVCDKNLHLQRSFGIDAKNPRGIAAADNNYLYVADTGGNRILRYTTDGNLDTTFGNNGSIGESGDANGQFNKPWAVGADWDKYIYVTDSGNNRIQVFKKTGKFEAQWQQKISYYKPGTLTPKSFRYEKRGYEEYLKQLSSQPYRINNSDRITAADRVPIKNPTGFCLSGSSLNGEIFLADTGNDKIKHLTANGYLYKVTGQRGNTPGCFNQPADIAYDYESDKLFVADAGNNRIQVFQLINHRGPITFVQQISDQNLSGPMAVDVMTEQPNQFIYIADTGNNRVIKLQNGLFPPGKSPEDVWEKFKDALRKNDINKALTYITPFERDNYKKFFDEIKPHLKEYVNGMGKLTPDSIEVGSAHYEMSHTDPNGDVFSFPVLFSQEENGNWTITKF